MTLDIEFTGRITANDDEIRVACDKAAGIIRAGGKSVAEAWADHLASIEARAEASPLWTAAEFAATADMGEGASLIAR